MSEKKKSGFVARTIVYFVLSFLSTVAIYINVNFTVTLREIIDSLTSPLGGAGPSVVGDFFDFAWPYLAAIVAAYLLFILVLRNKKTRKVVAKIVLWVLLIAFLVYCESFLNVRGYVKAISAKTTFFEDNYVDPRTADIKAPEKKKNLIFISWESVETAYASKDEGGLQDVNYLSMMTRVAKENTSFSNGEGLGGFICVDGTTWSHAAAFSFQSGLPFVFGPVDVARMGNRNYAGGAYTLGDILGENGYKLEYLTDCEASFSDDSCFYESHGPFEVYDYKRAKETGYIPKDYLEFWGFEDIKLYALAKQELGKLAESGQPFAMVIATMDTHHFNGYVCADCLDEYPEQTANVVSCADRQLFGFLSWLKEQPYYEDTVIVICGDHPRMDKSLVGDAKILDRPVFNCIINSVCADEAKGHDKNRTFTSMDMFPTLLASMGFTFNGDRLGVGTNLYSSSKTLAEEMGIQALDFAVGSGAKFYSENFSGR